MAPYYDRSPDRHGRQHQTPRSYNALLNSIARSQTYGFWSTEQAITNQNTGDYKTFSAIADKRLGDIDVRLLTAYRAFRQRRRHRRAAASPTSPSSTPTARRNTARGRPS